MTETESMVERVAKAINAGGMAWLNENDPKRMSLSWADVPDEVFARAAIEEMKTPTPRMVDAIHDGDFDIYWSYRADGTPGTPEDVYRAMIGKALEGIGDDRDGKHNQTRRKGHPKD